jgi:diketogulonate reductase-like aldo/keto reductase
MEYFKLSNGLKIPALGFGTWKIKGDDCVNAVKTAIEVGYRHIDTAWVYKNEKEVGQAIRESGIPRAEFFITTKCWNDHRGYDETMKAFEVSCENLQTDYLDLYLLHWPKAKDADSWRAMEELYEAGKIKAIGVSNYHQHHLEDLKKTARILPMVDQIEFSPRLTQAPLMAYLKEEGVQMEAWSPLMQGQVFNIDVLQELAKKYSKSIAQIVLRWNLDKGVVVLPKSVTPARIRENFEVFDFKLDVEDIARIDALNQNIRTGADPDNFDF